MKAENEVRRKLFRHHRLAIGTQEAVAGRLGWSRATIQRKEAGATPITLADLYAIYYLSPLEVKADKEVAQ